MYKLKLGNAFHATSIVVLSTSEDPAEYFGDLTARAFGAHDATAKRQYRKIWKALCGIDGCRCGVLRP